MASLQPAPLPSSRVLDRFELTDELLGEGGYGRVVAAKDTSMQPVGRVAAKVLETAAGQLTTAQVQRELNAYRVVQSGCRCEFMLHLFADAPLVDRHVLFLEMCAGGDLLDRVLDSGGLGDAQGRGLFAQLAAAVAHCHSCNVAHRDIKLENVMLTASGHARLGDLGLATIFPSGSSAWCTDFAGSPSYAAPEVWQTKGTGAGHDAYAADLWSVGVCVFTMLSNMFPVDSANPIQTADAPLDWRFELLLQCERAGACFAEELHAEVRRPLRVSAAARRLLGSLLATAPRERGTAADLLRCEWLHPPPDAAAGAEPAPGPASEAAGGHAAAAAGGADAPRDPRQPARGDASPGPAVSRSRSWLAEGRRLGSSEPEGEEEGWEMVWRSELPAAHADARAPLLPRRQAPVGAVLRRGAVERGR